MRAALLSLILVAAAACGGGGKKPSSIGNTATPDAEAWTEARALATIPSGVSFVLKLDTVPIKASDVVGPYWAQLANSSMSENQCPEISDVDAKVIAMVSGTSEAPVIGVWVLDTQTDKMRICVDKMKAANPGMVTVDGDFVSIVKDKMSGGIVYLDDRTAFVSLGKGPAPDRATVLAGTQRTDFARPPALDALVAANAPIWAYVAGDTPLFAASPFAQKFRVATVSVGLTGLLTFDGRVTMMRAEEAASTASMLAQQGQGMQQMGMIDELKAVAEGDALVVHAGFSKTSIDKMISLMGGFMGSIGGGNNTPPPVTP